MYKSYEILLPNVGYDNHLSPINCMAMSEDKSILATGAEDGQIRVWDISDGFSCAVLLVGHGSYITWIEIYDIYVVSASNDMTIRVWNVIDGTCVFTYLGHTDKIQRFIIAGGGEFIISASADDTARLWSFNFGNCQLETPLLRTFWGHKETVMCLIYIPKLVSGHDLPGIDPGDIIITGSLDWSAISWSMATGNSVQAFWGHQGAITVMSLSNNTLFTGSQDKTIRAWKIKTGECLREFMGHTNGVLTLLVLDKMIFSADTEGNVWAWTMQSENCERKFRGNTNSVEEMMVWDDKLFTVCTDGVIRTFDIKTGELIWFFEGHQRACIAARFKDHSMFSVGLDGIVFQWMLVSQKKEYEMTDKEKEETRKIKGFYKKEKKIKKQREKEETEKPPLNDVEGGYPDLPNDLNEDFQLGC